MGLSYGYHSQTDCEGREATNNQALHGVTSRILAAAHAGGGGNAE